MGVGVRVGEVSEGLRAPDNDTEQADKPRLRMATVAPRISTGRAMTDVNEFSDMIRLRAAMPRQVRRKRGARPVCLPHRSANYITTPTVRGPGYHLRQRDIRTNTDRLIKSVVYLPRAVG